MLVNSKYRLIGKATWCIAINVSAEWNSMLVPPDGATQLSERLWFVWDDSSLTGLELFYLKIGLKMVSDAIDKHEPGLGSILINVVQVDYNPTDYQPEGLVGAAVKWGAEAFHLPMPEIKAQYDKSRRRYIFSFEPEADGPYEETDNPSESIPVPREQLIGARQMLEQGQLVPATERASKVVRMVLDRIVRTQHRQQHSVPKTLSVTIEDLLAMIRRANPQALPSSITRHMVRVGTWYRDLKVGVQSPNKREAEAYLNSAEKVVSWAMEVEQSDSF